MCLFDKTGTLTTDELVTVGVAPAVPLAGTGGLVRTSSVASGLKIVPPPLAVMATAPAGAALVLAGCPSLVVVEALLLVILLIVLPCEPSGLCTVITFGRDA